MSPIRVKYGYNIMKNTRCQSLWRQLYIRIFLRDAKRFIVSKVLCHISFCFIAKKVYFISLICSQHHCIGCKLFPLLLLKINERIDCIFVQ